MSDLGQDKASLELKVMEVEYSINQKELARKGIQLEMAKIAVKQSHYNRSLVEIDEQIKTHLKDREALMLAVNKLQGE